MIRPVSLWNKQKKQLALQAYGSVAIPIGSVFLGLLLLLLLPYSVLSTVIGGLLTCGALSAAYYGLQTYLLPYLKVDRLYTQSGQREPAAVQGIYRGEKDTQRMRDGVRMRVLCVDAGDHVRNESIDREICLPAVFSAALEQNAPVCFETDGDLVTGIEPDCPVSIRLKNGAYQTSRLVYIAALIASVALWLTVHFAIGNASAPQKTEIAVCTIAYHTESEAVIEAALKNDGLFPAFSYTTTLESEQLSQYLSTYGLFDADLILLPKSQLDGTLDSDVPPLSKEIIPDGVKTVFNSQGEPIAVVLYDPSDASCLERFSSITDWIAIPSDEPYLLCLGPSANDSAALAASRLMSVLSENDFTK